MSGWYREIETNTRLGEERVKRYKMIAKFKANNLHSYCELIMLDLKLTKAYYIENNDQTKNNTCKVKRKNKNIEKNNTCKVKRKTKNKEKQHMQRNHKNKYEGSTIQSYVVTLSKG